MPTLLLAAVLAAQTTAAAPLSADELGRGYYLFLQGLALEAADDVPRAIDNYRQASALLPNSAEIHTALAGLYARQNQMADARREAAAALAADPANRDAHRLLGGLETAVIESAASGVSSALIADAINHLERSIEGGVSDPPVELALSSLYLRADNAPRAIARLRKLLVDHPDYPPALRLLVRAYEQAGQAQDATSTRERLSRAQPDAVEALVRRIDRLEIAGRWADAAAGWADVFEADPGGVIYRTRYAAALANSGHLDEARAVLNDATRDAPRDGMAWYLLSLVEIRAGNAAAAETAAKRVVEIDPNDPRGPLGLARAKYAGGDYRGVVDVLGPRVASPRPTDLTSGLFTEMASDLGAAYNKIGQQKKAVEMFEGARKRAPSDQELLFRLAAAYEQNKKFDLAERTFRELIGTNTTHAEALNYLGYMLAERGEKLPEAVDLIKRALAVDADNPSFLDSLGWAYFKMGQFESARDPLERAATSLPKSSVIHDHLGDLYVQMKRYADAAAAFDRALSGDRDGVDAPAITKKRDRARSLSGKS